MVLLSANGIESEGMAVQLRQAFGSFATGVTVVTAQDQDGNPIGFTANSFTSVSLDPPLLLVCIAKSSSNLQSFSDAGHFAVNILSEAQKDVSARFASRVKDRFAETHWRAGTAGCPLIEDAVAWFECATDNLVDAGDHLILIGRVVEFGNSDRRPLVYFRGHYLDLSIAEVAAEQVSHHGGVRVGCLLDCLGDVLLHRTAQGWSLPFGKTCMGFREARAEMEKTLAAAQISADIGALYSVFEAPSGNETWMIFHGELHGVSASEDHALFSLDSLPLGEIEVRQLGSMLRRYVTETRHARFGLYVDDARQSGDITQVETRTTPWTSFVNRQENLQ